MALTKEDIKKYGNIVQNYLSKPFTDNTISWDWALTSKCQMLEPKDLGVPNTSNTNVINRPNHGLAHTLKVVSYVPMVIDALIDHAKEKGDENLVKEYIKLKEHEDKIQFASFFHIVGRLNDGGWFDHQKKKPCEIYRTGLARSCKAFEEEAEKLQVFSKDEITSYKEQMSSYGDPKLLQNCFVRQIFYISHNMDLFRCFDFSQMQEKIKLAGEYVGKESAKNLFAHSLELIKNTGDRVLGDKIQKNYDTTIFLKASTDVDYCLDLIEKVDPISKGAIQQIPNEFIIKKELTAMNEVIADFKKRSLLKNRIFYSQTKIDEKLVAMENSQKDMQTLLKNLKEEDNLLLTDIKEKIKNQIENFINATTKKTGKWNKSHGNTYTSQKFSKERGV
jgi:hypothetical protein